MKTIEKIIPWLVFILTALAFGFTKDPLIETFTGLAVFFQVAKGLIYLIQNYNGKSSILKR